ncbi:hypothetical protein MTBPR1_220014 [Candidatus Terasakiella magnetica]|uniref:Uncharacterized protein n=1 Tax=Candidatus Terasakiella magnetica TaxID=1867952 RepID=A0A1C3RH11_9PROT|nr:hypothetical protein [Candidatus Terasakiella magnetica]SCA56581.1 hypothetical protein MTBPR1_220014 [Candidatus Terasakiella magnetica]
MMNLYDQYKDPATELKKMILVKKAKELHAFVQANPEIGKIHLDFTDKKDKAPIKLETNILL